MKRGFWVRIYGMGESKRSEKYSVDFGSEFTAWVRAREVAWILGRTLQHGLQLEI